MKKVGKTVLANLVSHVFNAPAFAIYILLLIVFEEKIDSMYSLLVLSTGILFLAFFPVVFILIEKIRGHVDYFVSDVKKRPKFFIPPLISYFTGFSLFHAIGLKVIALYYLVFFSVSLALFIVTFRWKISVHAAGVAGPATFLVYVYGLKFILLYLLVPMVSWSRVKLKAHNVSQVVAGAIIAILVTFVTCIIYL
ncbi:MAG: hypothetical protein DRJ47_05025 [Thermoprotei archaeon]|nr:MAG: hypothetical protein DRJ47_05025 [Thermoprotei archaeon]